MVMLSTTQIKIVIVVYFLTTSFALSLILSAFVFRFDGGFGTFVIYAQQDNDFLKLRQLDLIFGLFVPPTAVLFLSFFVVFVALLKRNNFLWKAYCAIMTLMMVVQIVDGILAFTYSDQVNLYPFSDNLQDSLVAAAKKSYPPIKTVSSDPETQFWVHTQKSLGCCGVHDSSDWTDAWRVKNDSADLEALHCYPKNYYIGCANLIRRRISTNAQYLKIGSICALVLEIIASFVAGYCAYTLAHPNV